MTSNDVAQWIGRVIDSDAPAVLGTLAQQLRHEHTDDPDAEQIARQADLKRARILGEN